MKMPLRYVIYIAIFTAVMAAVGTLKIPLPFTPIPLTLQVAVALLSGLVLGKAGWLSVLCYIALGLIGAPVFAEGGGISYVLRPSFGFLLGMVVAAFMVGYIKDQKSELRVFQALLSSLLGVLIIHIIGCAYFVFIMYTVVGSTKSLWQLAMLCSVPLLPIDALKAVIAAFTAVPLCSALRKANLLQSIK